MGQQPQHSGRQQILQGQQHKDKTMASTLWDGHLSNPLVTADQLYRRSFGSLPAELQDTIFFKSQCLTQAAGRLLELPQSVTAQANVILARYWLVESPLADAFSVGRPLFSLGCVFAG